MRQQRHTTYEQMGMAALLPGMQHMVALMQQHLDELRQQLAGLQQQPARVGRPKKQATEQLNAKGQPRSARSGWPDDPEERKAEMRRRQAVAQAKRGGKSNGEVQSKVQKQRWLTRTPKEKAAWVKAVQKGKRKAARERQQALVQGLQQVAS